MEQRYHSAQSPAIIAAICETGLSARALWPDNAAFFVHHGKCSLT